MFATLWWPSTNLFGPGFWWPAVFVAAYAVLAWSTGTRGVFVGAPVVLLVFALLSEGCPFPDRRRFPDADDFLGYYTLLAGAGVAAMELARRGTRFSLLFAGPFLFVAGWLLALEGVSRAGEMVLGPYGFRSPHRVVLWGTAVWVPLFVVVIWHVSLPYRRQRRARRGCCPECGYDLRGSHGRCPECGLAAAGCVDVGERGSG